MKTNLNWNFSKHVILDHYPYKKCSVSEASTMNFSNLISRDNLTFHYQKTLCVIHMYTTPIKVTIQTNQMSQTLFKGTQSNFPLRRWISQSNPPPLANTPHPPHGVYLDRCISKVLLFSLSLAFLTSLRNFFHRIK